MSRGVPAVAVVSGGSGAEGEAVVPGQLRLQELRGGGSNCIYSCTLHSCPLRAAGTAYELKKKKKKKKKKRLLLGEYMDPTVSLLATGATPQHNTRALKMAHRKAED